MAEVMHCYRHPKRETRVSCATCGRPICTECMRSTYVGIKCPDDARLPRGAQAGAMKTNQIVWSLLAGLGVALVGWIAVAAIFQIGFLSVILSALAGYGAGMLVHRAGGRNGGTLAVTVSVVAVLLAFAPFLVSPILSGVVPNAFQALAAVVAAVAAGFGGRGGY